MNIAYFEHDLGYGYIMNQTFSSCSYPIYQILSFLSESFGCESSRYLTILQPTLILATSPPFKPSDPVLKVQRDALAMCQVGHVIWHEDIQSLLRYLWISELVGAIFILNRQASFSISHPPPWFLPFAGTCTSLVSCCVYFMLFIYYLFSFNIHFFFITPFEAWVDLLYAYCS